MLRMETHPKPFDLPNGSDAQVGGWMGTALHGGAEPVCPGMLEDYMGTNVFNGCFTHLTFPAVI